MSIEQIVATRDGLRLVLDYLTDDDKRRALFNFCSGQLDELEKCLAIYNKFCDSTAK